MSQDTVKIQLELATKAAEEALKQFTKQTKDASNTFDIFKGTLAANVVLDTLKVGFDKISDVFATMIHEASAAEASVKRMEIALGQAGLAGQGNSQFFQDLADSLELTTIYSGESAEGAVALFASLNNLSREGIAQAVKLSADLAATMGIDLTQASEMVSKAINGQMTAFNKLGIQIDKGRTDSENLANVTKALAGQQGAAEKSAGTYSAALTKMENIKGKLLESFGKLITQNPAVIAGMEALTSAFASTASFIEDNRENITLLVESLAGSIAIVGTAGLAWVAYTTYVSASSVALTTLTTAATAAWAAITGPVGLIIAAIVAVGAAIFAVVKYWNDIKVATFEATAAVLDYAAKAAGVFSKDASVALQSEAQALRDKAAATRELIEQEKKNKADAANPTPETQTVGANAKQEQEELKKRYQERLLMKKEFNNNSYVLDQELKVQLLELEATHNQAMLTLNEGFTLTDLQNQLSGEEQRLAMRQEYERKALETANDIQMQKALLIEDAAAKEKAVLDANLKAQYETQKLANKQQIDLQKQRFSTEEQLNNKRISDQKSTYSTIATLSNSNNKTLATIGKAAALTQIAIDGPQAVTKALAAFPPPFNFAMAAAVGTAVAAQAAQVAGLNFDQGGIVPGNSFRGDRVQANVNSRELVLNMAQQKELYSIAKGNGSTANPGNEITNALLSGILEAVSAGHVIQVNGREIINVVKDGLGSGRSLSY